MYTIIGGDGKQYGPVDIAQLRQWIADGRANAQTQVQAAGSTVWQPVSSIPELAAIVTPPVAGGPPPITPPPVPTAVVPGVPAAGRPQTSGLAVTSLVLGVLSLFCSIITAIPGLIVGLISLSQIKKSGGRLTGRGLAIAGISISSAMIVMIPIMAALLLPALGSARSKAREAQCLNNLKQIGLGLAQYSEDYGGHLPEAKWCDRIQIYGVAGKVLQCPEQPGKICGYAFNANMLGQPWQGDPTVILAIDFGGDWNGTISGPQMLGLQPHRHGWTVLFNDGHVESGVSIDRLLAMHWQPTH